MLRYSLGTLVVVTVLGSSGWAQVYVGPGSTPQGDYLRGVGVAAYGLGQYEKDAAEAGSINTETFIRLNNYIADVLNNENQKNAAHRAALIAKREENYNKIQQRIRENPEERDVMIGDSLNAVLQDLLSPKIHESAIRYSPVPLSVDIIRRIPFKLDAEGVRFSMQRLSGKGKGRWPVALQDDQFVLERRAYERAIDNALEQQIEGKMSLSAIDAFEAAVDDLFRKLDQVLKPSTEKHYLEAKHHLNELKKAAELIKSHKIELVLGELDKYSGTTVNDLRLFMQKHSLRFAATATPEERKLYPELYAALIQQRELVAVAGTEPKK